MALEWSDAASRRSCHASVSPFSGLVLRGGTDLGSLRLFAGFRERTALQGRAEVREHVQQERPEDR